MQVTSLCAICNTPPDRLLPLIEQYYLPLRLSLKEVAIGNHSSDYLDKECCYKDLAEYNSQNAIGSEEDARDFDASFDLFENLRENSAWTIISYPTFRAKNTLNIDKELAQLLSEKIQSSVINFYENSSVSVTILGHYFKGSLRDSYRVEDFSVKEATGFFRDFPKKEYETVCEYCAPFYYFFHEWRLFPDSSDLDYNNEVSRRPFYLKGDQEDLQKYLASIVLTLTP